MNDETTTVLYTLTTFAQSCAALAAFVGAIGVFRMQMLRDQRRDAERELRTSSEGIVTRDMHAISIREVLEAIDDEASQIITLRHYNFERATKARGRWEAFPRLLLRARSALISLEVWNLCVIGVSLIGFNYVPTLAGASWFSCALWVAALGTVLVTLWCVVVWTEGVER